MQGEGNLTEEQSALQSSRHTKGYLLLTLIGCAMMGIALLILETKIGPVVFGLGAAICFSPAILISIKSL